MGEERQNSSLDSRQVHDLGAAVALDGEDDVDGRLLLLRGDGGDVFPLPLRVRRVARDLDALADALVALSRLAEGRAILLNQAVLLKGVNDDPETLGALMRAMDILFAFPVLLLAITIVVVSIMEPLMGGSVFTANWNA